MRSVILFASLFYFVYTVKARCPDIILPKWGEVFCDRGMDEGSLCTISCEKYYDMEDTTLKEYDTMCVDGEWTESPVFKCNPLICEYQHAKPSNGDLICSAKNLMKGLCVYYCDEHFDMVDVQDRTTQYSCEDDGDGDEFGVWANSMNIPFPPVCEHMKCVELEAPLNGKVVCSASNFAGSNCVFFCDEGFDLAGTSESVTVTICGEDPEDHNIATWDYYETPICKQILPESCKDPMDVEDATYDCTTDTLSVGTICNLKCLKPGEYAVGESLICNEMQMWDTATGGAMPNCVECSPVKKIQVLALVHSESGNAKLELSSKLIARFTAMLIKAKYSVTTRVQGYNEVVSKERFENSGMINKDNRKLMQNYFSYSGKANIGNALDYANMHFSTMPNQSVKVLMIVTNELTLGADSEMKAQALWNLGVRVFGFGMSANLMNPDFTVDDFEKLTGDAERVYVINSPRSVEKARNKFVEQVAKAAIEEGCTTE